MYYLAIYVIINNNTNNNTIFNFNYNENIIHTKFVNMMMMDVMI